MSYRREYSEGSLCHQENLLAKWILSALSALLALAPFLYIWAIIREVIAAAPDFGKADQAAWCIDYD